MTFCHTKCGKPLSSVLDTPQNLTSAGFYNTFIQVCNLLIFCNNVLLLVGATNLYVDRAYVVVMCRINNLLVCSYRKIINDSYYPGTAHSYTTAICQWLQRFIFKVVTFNETSTKQVHFCYHIIAAIKQPFLHQPLSFISLEVNKTINADLCIWKL